MAHTRGTRYRSGCAGEERGGAATARAVCAEVLSVVHHRPMGDWNLSNRLWTIAMAVEVATHWQLKLLNNRINQAKDSDWMEHV